MKENSPGTGANDMPISVSADGSAQPIVVNSITPIENKQRVMQNPRIEEKAKGYNWHVPYDSTVHTVPQLAPRQSNSSPATVPAAVMPVYQWYQITLSPGQYDRLQAKIVAQPDQHLMHRSDQFNLYFHVG